MMTFDELFDDVMSRSVRFGHRQHIELTWLAVRQHGRAAAIELISDGIQRTARYAGAPQKYHVTISRAWVELVAYHVSDPATPATFDVFAERYPALLDKRLLGGHYRSTTLASPTARSSWVAPDLKPLPPGRE
jgi:hypothetical protein